MLLFALFFALFSAFAMAAPHKHNAVSYVQKASNGAIIFELGDIKYLATTKFPVATLPPFSSNLEQGAVVPFAVLDVQSVGEEITRQDIEATVLSYLENDDVFNDDWLQAVYVSSAGSFTVAADAIEYFMDMGIQHVLWDEALSSTSARLRTIPSMNLPPGPYLLTISDSAAVNPVYRLYEDTHRTFMSGCYQENDGSGNYTLLDYTTQPWAFPAVPVPSHLHYLKDPRPFAGYRLGVKDIFDVQGLITTGGSLAWAWYNSPAEKTAVSIQRMVDLGAVIVGKQKTAQFASGAPAWATIDYLYPFNARGDGWLTCAASSSGGGCSMGAYDWLQMASCSDTGGSIRLPAAVNNLYGLRPSQGYVSLEGVQTLSGPLDTAGVYFRDPYEWAAFHREWSTPELYQPANTTGLSPLADEVRPGMPTTLVVPTDYFPLNNSAAQDLMENFIIQISTILDLTVDRTTNLTASIQNATVPASSGLNLTDLAAFNSDLDLNTQYWEVGEPLIAAYAVAFDGRFPPIDTGRRNSWTNFTQTRASFAESVRLKSLAVEWYESHIQIATEESCSDSIILGDISTGGVPSFREQALNDGPDATLVWQRPAHAALTWSALSPLFGTADLTVPVGQVPYISPVTGIEEMWPVSANLMVKRGCDHVLVEAVERLADAGVLRTVKTGRTAF